MARTDDHADARQKVSCFLGGYRFGDVLEKLCPSDQNISLDYQYFLIL